MVPQRELEPDHAGDRAAGHRPDPASLRQRGQEAVRGSARGRVAAPVMVTLQLTIRPRKTIT